mmetsp:Transcript_70468/g.196104  ORF Transcript_70468/g.196104 Transcript_70468/m.196104 type:complete len:261 (+) Transcript_70468:4793-5575(+)
MTSASLRCRNSRPRLHTTTARSHLPSATCKPWTNSASSLFRERATPMLRRWGLSTCKSSISSKRSSWLSSALAPASSRSLAMPRKYAARSGWTGRIRGSSSCGRRSRGTRTTSIPGSPRSPLRSRRSRVRAALQATRCQRWPPWRRSTSWARKMERCAWTFVFFARGSASCAVILAGQSARCYMRCVSFNSRLLAARRSARNAASGAEARRQNYGSTQTRRLGCNSDAAWSICWWPRGASLPRKPISSRASRSVAARTTR